MPTSLVFRTPPGHVTIPVGTEKNLGTVDVHDYDSIRLVADELAGSAGAVRVRIVMTVGGKFIADLDSPVINPGSQATVVYDVPGTTLTVFAKAIGLGTGDPVLDGLVTGSTSVDVLIYGTKPLPEGPDLL
jgi:hypothetical protein